MQRRKQEEGRRSVRGGEKKRKRYIAGSRVEEAIPWRMGNFWTPERLFFRVDFSFCYCCGRRRLREEMLWYHEHNRPGREKERQREREGGRGSTGRRAGESAATRPAEDACCFWKQDSSPGRPLILVRYRAHLAPLFGLLASLMLSPSSSISWCRAGEGVSQSVHRILENPFFLLMLLW